MAGQVDVRWTELSRVARAIERKWADQPVKAPPTFQLEPLKLRVHQLWQREKTLESVSKQDARWLSHILFHPEPDRASWLANDTDFVESAVSIIRRRPRSVRSLLHNVLKVWPVEVAPARRLASLLLEELQTTTAVRLREWRQRVSEFKLLSADGPRHMANMWRAQPDRRAGLLAEAGLDGELASSGFVAAAEREVLRRLREDFSNEDYSGAESLQQMLAPSGQLTFRQHSGRIGESLLLPFVERNPPMAVQETLQTFLLTHLKDPRLTKTSWSSVSASARDVMLRWMVKASLEDFFRLIARSAEEKHWTYRKAFWNGYYKKGHISHAWVILGDNAQQEALRKWRDAVPAHGRLLRGGSPDHCVLLLKIGALTIAEWSHNGTCRVWTDNQDGCPPFYRPGYFRDELKSNPAYEQRHDGNTSYTWQRQLVGFIREETGIRVMHGDYQVR